MFPAEVLSSLLPPESISLGEHHNQLEVLVKHTMLGPTPESLMSKAVEGLRACIPNTFPWEANAVVTRGKHYRGP